MWKIQYEEVDVAVKIVLSENRLGEWLVDVPESHDTVPGLECDSRNQ